MQQDGINKREEGAEEEGGFFLEAVAMMDEVEFQPASGSESKNPTPTAISRPKLPQINANRAIRELREQQRRVEKRITIGVSVFVFALIGGLVMFQSDVFENGFVNIVSKLSSMNGKTNYANCSLPDRRHTAECQNRSGDTHSTWKSIERSRGQGNHFSLTGN